MMNCANGLQLTRGRAQNYTIGTASRRRLRATTGRHSKGSDGSPRLLRPTIENTTCGPTTTSLWEHEYLRSDYNAWSESPCLCGASESRLLGTSSNEEGPCLARDPGCLPMSEAESESVISLGHEVRGAQHCPMRLHIRASTTACSRALETPKVACAARGRRRILDK